MYAVVRYSIILFCVDIPNGSGSFCPSLMINSPKNLRVYIKLKMNK